MKHIINIFWGGVFDTFDTFDTFKHFQNKVKECKNIKEYNPCQNRQKCQRRCNMLVGGLELEKQLGKGD